MGSQESKIEQPPKQENDPKESVLDDNVPSTPILTPVDPRSPSVNIARTPLELILGLQTTDTSSAELEDETVETKDIVNVVLGIDPRSPTVEFTRTPIIVGAIKKEKPSKPQNKNLNNVLRTEIQTTPVSVSRRSSTLVPPKLLSTSPATIVSNYKRKSFVGLLETNVDFTETDLDSVCQAKNNLNNSLPVDLTEEIPCNQLKNQMDALQVDASESQVTPVKCKSEKDEDDKTVGEKTINVTAQVKDFDKKLCNLIYQDDSDDDNKLGLKLIKNKENNRTPLSVRNSNEDPKKAQSRLKVSDKPRRSENSKIPVFKDHHSRKVGVQCENTPPNKREECKYKTKVSHWDADKTLVI